MSKKSIAAALCIAFVISFFTVSLMDRAFAQSGMQPLKGKTVVIDAGHGGYDPGAFGVSTKTPESDINLDIAKKLEVIFEKSGAKVIMTRNDAFALAPEKYADMQKRAEIIRTADCDIMISVHQNMYEESYVRGPQVFYLPGAKEAKKLAACVQDELDQVCGTDKEIIAADLFILKSGAQPSIIAECGFLSNKEDEALLLSDEHKTRLARAIAMGAAEYFKGGR